MFFLGGHFVSSIISTLKSKKTFKKPKNLKKNSKKPRFFPALTWAQHSSSFLQKAERYGAGITWSPTSLHSLLIAIIAGRHLVFFCKQKCSPLNCPSLKTPSSNQTSYLFSIVHRSWARPFQVIDKDCGPGLSSWILLSGFATTHVSALVLRVPSNFYNWSDLLLWHYSNFIVVTFGLTLLNQKVKRFCV